jgi:hypothetical protein
VILYLFITARNFSIVIPCGTESSAIKGAVLSGMEDMQCLVLISGCSENAEVAVMNLRLYWLHGSSVTPII